MGATLPRWITASPPSATAQTAALTTGSCGIAGARDGVRRATSGSRWASMPAASPTLRPIRPCDRSAVVPLSPGVRDPDDPGQQHPPAWQAGGAGHSLLISTPLSPDLVCTITKLLTVLVALGRHSSSWTGALGRHRSSRLAVAHSASCHPMLRVAMSTCADRQYSPWF